MIHRGLVIAGLLLALFAGTASVPAQAQAASDYARVTVPDVSAATAFLRDTLDCDVLDAGSDRALLECGQGHVVEMVRGKAQPHAAPLRLPTEDADATLGWLRQRHIPVVAGRNAGNLGPDGLLHVDVQTPWGQPLELVGRTTLMPLAATPLASD